MTNLATIASQAAEILDSVTIVHDGKEVDGYAQCLLEIAEARSGQCSGTTFDGAETVPARVEREFAALESAHPELVARLVDVASRGEWPSA